MMDKHVQQFIENIKHATLDFGMTQDEIDAWKAENEKRAAKRAIEDAKPHIAYVTCYRGNGRPDAPHVMRIDAGQELFDVDPCASYDGAAVVGIYENYAAAWDACTAFWQESVIEDEDGYTQWAPYGSKVFPLGVLLSAITEWMPARFEEVHRFLEFMAGEDLTVHALPRVADECKPYLLEAFPQLADIDIDSDMPDMVGLQAKYGNEFAVFPIPREAHEAISPVDEFYRLRKS